MKIVLLDDKDFNATVINFFEGEKIPGLKKSDFLSAGSYQECIELLKRFSPKQGEKTIFIIAGTVNNKDGSYPLHFGNVFDLVSDWLEKKVGEYQAGKKEKELKNLQSNVSIILNPNNRRYYEDGYFGPHLRIRELCKSSGLRMIEHDKASGIGELTKHAQSLLLGNEVRHWTWRK